MELFKFLYLTIINKIMPSNYNITIHHAVYNIISKSSDGFTLNKPAEINISSDNKQYP